MIELVIGVISFIAGRLLYHFINIINKKEALAIKETRRHCILLEIMMCIIGLLLYGQYGLSSKGIIYMVFSGLLIVLAYIDKVSMILPTSIIQLGFILGVLTRCISSIVQHRWTIMWEGLLAAVIGYGCFRMLYSMARKLMHREALGFGDVRLVGLLGLYIGLEGFCIMLLIACCMAIIVGVILLGKYKKSRPYPLGPFLCSATILMLLYGTDIVRYYEKLIM